VLILQTLLKRAYSKFQYDAVGTVASLTASGVHLPIIFVDLNCEFAYFDDSGMLQLAEDLNFLANFPS
jgi:hypothetical protein